MENYNPITQSQTFQDFSANSNPITDTSNDVVSLIPTSSSSSDNKFSNDFKPRSEWKKYDDPDIINNPHMTMNNENPYPNNIDEEYEEEKIYTSTKSIQEIRDDTLGTLSGFLSPEQLKLVDLAMSATLNNCMKDASIRLPRIINRTPDEVFEFLTRKHSKGLAPGTLVQYRTVLVSFFSVTQKPAQRITDWDILKFLEYYRVIRKASGRRVASVRVVLHGFFRFLADSGKISSNPMVTVEPVKFVKKLREPLSDVELEQVRYACGTNLRLRALLEFFYATGCRISEVVSLNITDLDTVNRKVKVLGKGNKERWVYLNAPAIVSMEKYLASREDYNEALFVSDRRPHQRLKKNAIEKIFRELGETAGLNRRLFPHLIRHTSATHWHRRGMELENIQVILGHEDIESTKIYTKLDTAMVQQSYNQNS